MSQIHASPHLLPIPLLPAVQRTDCILTQHCPSPHFTQPCRPCVVQTIRLAAVSFVLPDYLVCPSVSVFWRACVTAFTLLISRLRPLSYFLCALGALATSPFTVRSPFPPSPSCAGGQCPRKLSSAMCSAAFTLLPCSHGPCSFKLVSILHSKPPSILTGCVQRI